MPTTHRYRLLLEHDDDGVWLCVEDGLGRIRYGPWMDPQEAELKGRWPMVCRWRRRASRLGGHVLRPSATQVFVVLPDAVIPRRGGILGVDGPCSVASPVAPRK